MENLTALGELALTRVANQVDEARNPPNGPSSVWSRSYFMVSPKTDPDRAPGRAFPREA
jgi:K+-sensing histidine kinase KdpD